MHLREMEGFPKELLNCSPRDLHKILGGPTLIHVKGKRSPALFVSVLLHGNEWTGFLSIQKFFKEQKGVLERSMYLFIGNTFAAEKNLRCLPGQYDFNRIWPGAPSPHGEEHILAEQVFIKMRDEGIFASIDIHNNTGPNPHYACINIKKPPFLRLATLFSKLVVYTLYPKGIQSFAFAQLAPSVTLECGQSGEPEGIKRALDFLKTCLSYPQSFEEVQKIEEAHDLFHTVATVRIDRNVDFGFSKNKPLCLRHELKSYNFRELEIGTVFAETADEETPFFDVRDEFGNLVTSEYFERSGKKIKLKKKLMPAMITADLEIIRQDCFCYLMERYS